MTATDAALSSARSTPPTAVLWCPSPLGVRPSLRAWDGTTTTRPARPGPRCAIRSTAMYTICQTRAANNTKEVYLSRRVRDFFSAAPCCLLAGGRPVQARETWAGRRNLGNLINFFAVSWGLMPLAITTVTTLISPLLFDRLRPHYYTLKNCNSE